MLLVLTFTKYGPYFDFNLLYVQLYLLMSIRVRDPEGIADFSLGLAAIHLTTLGKSDVRSQFSV